MMPAERQLRKQLQQKRIEVLDKISDLTSEHCLKCPSMYKQPSEGCEECPAYKEIRALGKELIDIANSKPREESDLEAEVVNKSSDVQVKLDSFSPESYLRMKENGKLDEHIRKRLGVSRSAFYEWKQKNGLVIPKNNKLANFTEEEYNQLRSEGLTKSDIARKIGVSRDSIYRWVKRNIKQVETGEVK